MKSVNDRVERGRGDNVLSIWGTTATLMIAFLHEKDRLDNVKRKGIPLANHCYLHNETK